MEVVAQQAFLGPFEVCVHNEWHRVGDHHWTKQDATVACRQLELPYEGLTDATLYTVVSPYNGRYCSCVFQ